MFSHAFGDITEINNFALDRTSFYTFNFTSEFLFLPFSLCPDSFRLAKVLELVLSLNGLPDVGISSIPSTVCWIRLTLSDRSRELFELVVQ